MSICQIEAINAGGAYPRSCPACGFAGKCVKGLDHPFRRPKTQPASILGEALRLYIAAHKIEQKTVAVETGISEATLSRVLNEGRLPDAASLARLMCWMTGEHVPAESGLSICGASDSLARG